MPRKSKRDEILSSLARDRVLVEINHWFGRFERGRGALVCLEDIEGLVELVKLREELSGECPALPALESAESEIVEMGVDGYPKARAFVGMGM